MIPERDFFLAKAEVRRRNQEAAEARLVREAIRGARRQRAEQVRPTEPPSGAFGWLRRLAGARR
ncbi:MAG: hypothetical protein HGA45_36545 [Chloroflexales bacterium]|nr:hypothetical protein [Chloroflexales bacterium]